MRSHLRLAALALGLLAVSPALAGCIGAVSIAPTDEVSMDALLPAARREAAAWRAGAVFTAAGAVEAPNASDVAIHGWVPPPDPDVGNGRAVAWAFEFTDPDNGDRLNVVMASNRSVVWRGVGPGAAGSPSPLEWSVGSGAAVAAARANATFAHHAVAAGEPTFATLLDHVDPEIPFGPYNPGDRDPGRMAAHWLVLVTDADGTGVAVAVVNATSGEVVRAGSFDEVIGFTGPEVTLYEAQVDGELSLVAPRAAHTFPVAEGATQARVVLCWGSRVAAGTIEMAIVGPGNASERAHSSGPFTSGMTMWHELQPAPGGYEVQLELVNASVAADYQLHMWVWRGEGKRDITFGPFQDCSEDSRPSTTPINPAAPTPIHAPHHHR